VQRVDNTGGSLDLDDLDVVLVDQQVDFFEHLLLVKSRPLRRMNVLHRWGLARVCGGGGRLCLGLLLTILGALLPVAVQVAVHVRLLDLVFQ